MINTIFYFPETKKQYEDELRDNGISSHTISFVEDTQEIYKNGKLYGNGKLTLSNILQAILDAEDTEDKFDGSKLEGVIDDMIDRRIHNVEKWVNTILQMIKNGHTEDILILGEGETVTRDGKRYIILYNKDGENITEEMIEKNYANVPKGSYYNRVDTILHFMNGILASTEETDPVKVLYSTGGNSNTSSMNSGSNPDDPNSEPINPDDIQPGDSGIIKNDDNDPDRYIIGAVSLNPELVAVRVVEQPDPKDNYIKWDVIKNPETDTPVTIIVRYSVAPDELISIVVKHVAVTSVFVSGEKDTLIVPQETDLTATLTFDNTARNLQWLNDNTTVVWSSDLNNIIVTPKQDTKQAKAKASGQRKLDVTVTASVKVNDITEASGNYTIHVIPKPQEDINDPDINPDPSNPSSDGEITIPEGLTIKNVTFEPAQARVHGVNSDYFIVDFTRGGSSFTYKATAIPDEDTNVKITVEYNETSDVTNVHVKVKGSGWPNSSVPDSITPTEPDGNGNYNIPIPEGLTIDYVERTYNPANPTVEGTVNENIVTLNYQKGGTTLTYKVTAQPDVNEVVTLTIHYEGATKTSKVTINLNGSGWTPIVVPQTNNEDPDDNSGRVDLPNGLTIKKVTFTPLKTNVHGVKSDYFNVSYTVGGTYFTYNTIATPDNETTVTITIEYNESDEISTVIVVVAGSNWTTPTPKTITLNKDNITLSENNTTDSITATVKDQYGNSMNNQTVTFELSNVNPTNVVSGLQNGNTYVLTADISKLSAGGDNGSATITAKLAGCADEVRNITITAPSQSSSPGGDEPGEPTNPSTPIIDGDDGSGDGTEEHPKEVENGDDGTINTDSSKDISSFQVYYGTSLNGPWVEENSNNKLIDVTQVDTKYLSWTVIKNPDVNTYAKIHINYTDGTSSDVYFLINHITTTIRLNSISLSQDSLDFNENGNSQSITVEYDPANATNKTVTAVSNNENVVTCTVNGSTITITPHLPGTTNIVVTSEDGGHTAECSVHVEAEEPGGDEPSNPSTPEIDGGNGNGDGSDENPKEVEEGDEGTITPDPNVLRHIASAEVVEYIPPVEQGTHLLSLEIIEPERTSIRYTVIDSPVEDTIAKVKITYVEDYPAEYVYFLIKHKDVTPVIVKPDNVYFKTSATELEVGDEITLEVYTNPLDAETTISWITSNPSVISKQSISGDSNLTYGSTEKCTIKALTAGKSTITATTDNGKQVSTEITVMPNAATISSITIDGLSIVPLNEDEPRYTANITMSDGNQYTGNVSWSIQEGSDKASISASTGRLRAKKTGDIVIKVTAGEITQTKNVTIVAIKRVSVEPNMWGASLPDAEDKQLTATVYTMEYDDSTQSLKEVELADTVTWSSSNTNVATVNNAGLVHFVDVGECAISAATTYVEANGNTIEVSGSCIVKVTQESTGEVTMVDIDPQSMTMNIGESRTVTASVNQDARDYSIGFSVEQLDNCVRILNNNDGTATVTALKAGSAAVKATVTLGGNDNFVASCHVTILSPKSINIVLESPDDGIDALLSEEPMCYYSVYNEGGEPDTMPIDQWTKFYDGDTYKAKSGAIVIDQGLRILVSAGTVDGYDSPDEDIDLGYDEISDDIILTYFKDINASIKLYDASTNQLIDQNNIELSLGDTKTITAKVFIDNVEDSSKIVNYWRKSKVSGDGDIVDIEYIGNNCTITAIGYGTSTVSAVYGSHGKAVGVIVPDPDSQFRYVDLGLPSGTKWANMNLGASSVTDAGDGYLWGDPNSAYTAGSSVDNGWESEYYTTGAGSYSGDIQRGSSMDIAHSVLGGNWYTPSKEDIEELISNTTMEFIDSENSKYLLVTSNINGNSIKIPYIPNIKAQIQSTTTEYESSWSDVSSSWSGYYYTLTSEGQTRGGSKHFRAPVRAIYVE